MPWYIIRLQRFYGASSRSMASLQISEIVCNACGYTANFSVHHHGYWWRCRNFSYSFEISTGVAKLKVWRRMKRPKIVIEIVRWSQSMISAFFSPSSCFSGCAKKVVQYYVDPPIRGSFTSYNRVGLSTTFSSLDGIFVFNPARDQFERPLKVRRRCRMARDVRALSWIVVLIQYEEWPYTR